MVRQLPPELMIRIVREIRHDPEPHHHSRMRTEKQVQEEISALMSLIKTSKVGPVSSSRAIRGADTTVIVSQSIHEEATHLYYKNCVTKNVDTFLLALAHALGRHN